MVAITLLCLSDDAHGNCVEILSLMGVVGIGLASTKVATKPAELFNAKAQLDVHEILIIDGLEHESHDILGLISFVRSKSRSGILVAVRNHSERLAAIAAGADIAFRLPILPSSFLEDVHDLAAFYAPENQHSLMATAHVTRYAEMPLDASVARMPIENVRYCSKNAPMAAHSAVRPIWQLITGGRSFLRAPDGNEVRLSRQECFFFDALFTAEDRCLTYRAWQEFARAWRSGNAQGTLLTLLVGRVRRKFLKNGIALPIEVNRGTGYGFHDECVVLRELACQEQQACATPTAYLVPQNKAVLDDSTAKGVVPPVLHPVRWDFPCDQVTEGADPDGATGQKSTDHGAV